MKLAWMPPTKPSILASLFLVLALVLLVAPADAQLFYKSGNQDSQVDAVQLWYNGLWKHTGWVNGTLVMFNSCNPCTNLLVVMEDVLPPFDSHIRKAVGRHAKGVVMIRHRTGTAGQSMYFVPGTSQYDLNIPVVEIFEPKNKEGTVMAAMKNSPGAALQVQVWPMENMWKRANDKTAFQVFWNVFLSLFELAIILLCVLRLYSWFQILGFSFKSIGPLCILIELIGTLFRLANTIVDPFFSFRTMPSSGGMILATASLPFFFTTGILLTFYWAESLSSHKVQASPFIAEYKIAAIIVIALLYVGEISTSAYRTTTAASGNFSPTYVTQAYYCIVAIVLIVCYLICAYKITQRLKSFGHQRKSFVRKMTLRFAISTSGYFLFVFLDIASIFTLYDPWGYKVVLNLLLASANLAAIIQVYGLAPPESRNPRTSSSSKGKGDSHSVGKVSSRGKDSASSLDEERLSKAVLHETDSDETSSTSSDIQESEDSSQAESPV